MQKPLTTKNLADAAGISTATVRRMASRGLLRAVKDYRGWRAFAPSEIERLRGMLGWGIFEDAPPQAPDGRAPSRRGP